jgi:hypothetical protein
MRGRVIQVTKAAVGGFVLIFLVGISVISVISLAALVANVSALDIGIGPLPLMSFRNSSAGYSFQSQWGIGALAYVGAVVGALLAIRRQLSDRKATSSGGSSTQS